MIPFRIAMTLVAVLSAHSLSSDVRLGPTIDLRETAFQLTCADAATFITVNLVQVTSALRRMVRYDVLRTTPAFSINYDGVLSMQVLRPDKPFLRYTLWNEDNENGRRLLKFKLEVERRDGVPTRTPVVPGEIYVRFPTSTDAMPGFVNVEHRPHDNYVDYFGGRSSRVARYFCAPEKQISEFLPEEPGVRCERHGRMYVCEP